MKLKLSEDSLKSLSQELNFKNKEINDLRMKIG